MLEQEREFFARNRAEWLRRHAGRVVLVKGERLVGVFNTIDEAVKEGARLFGLDSFLIRRVEEIEETLSAPALTLGILDANATRSI